MSTGPVVAPKPVHSSTFDTLKVTVKIQHEPLNELRSEHPKRIFFTNRQYRVRGRLKKTFAIVSSPYDNGSLTIEASAPKFMTGQNLYGSENLQNLAIELIDEVLRRMKIRPTKDERRKYRSGDFELLRVDYANHLSCPDPETASAFMNALRSLSAAKAWNFSQYEGKTLYWGQHSSRSTLKAYLKGPELEKHPPGPDVRDREKVMRAAKNLVRFEFTLRAEELKRLELNRPGAWTPEVARKILNEKVSRIKPIKGQVMNMEGLKKLTPVMQDRFELFLLGKFDAFSRHASTFAKVRAAILEFTGIDVGLAMKPEEQQKNWATLQQVFEKGWKFVSRDTMFEYFKPRAKEDDTQEGPSPPSRQRRNRG